MGMSPRMKGKKGRFGPDGLIPTIKILSHVPGDTVTLGAPFTMTALALDPEDGDVSASITWSATQVPPVSGQIQFTPSDPVDGSTVVNITVETGNYDIQATIIDGGQTAVAVVSLVVVV